jgi:hypothetical protein
LQDECKTNPGLNVNIDMKKNMNLDGINNNYTSASSSSLLNKSSHSIISSSKKSRNNSEHTAIEESSSNNSGLMRRNNSFSLYNNYNSNVPGKYNFHTGARDLSLSITPEPRDASFIIQKKINSNKNSENVSTNNTPTTPSTQVSHVKSISQAPLYSSKTFKPISKIGNLNNISSGGISKNNPIILNAKLQNSNQINNTRNIQNIQNIHKNQISQDHLDTNKYIQNNFNKNHQGLKSGHSRSHSYVNEQEKTAIVLNDKVESFNVFKKIVKDRYNQDKIVITKTIKYKDGSINESTFKIDN